MSQLIKGMTLILHLFGFLLQVLMLISLAVVLVSILAFVCESHYQFQVLSNDTSVKAPDPELYYGSSNKNCYGVSSEFMGQPYPDTDPVMTLTYIDYGCLAFFVVELIIRFSFAPKKCEFMKGVLNIIDIVCIVPQMVSIALELGNYGEHANTAGEILKVISILRMIRVLRIFKLMKHYSAFKVLAYTIKVRYSHHNEYTRHHKPVRILPTHVSTFLCLSKIKTI